ncbi:hypothetical protein KS4_12010 [Poriferisphaera corsica]|uniref:Uncharacterized protein n=1 Tax=Poriferisphaera corsica TaxID=2528020 RepID=A0A517YSF7_9BACT|nr:hypothetical protein KS4_12010 [Poriferisphaera corsica]
MNGVLKTIGIKRLGATICSALFVISLLYLYSRSPQTNQIFDAFNIKSSYKITKIQDYYKIKLLNGYAEVFLGNLEGNDAYISLFDGDQESYISEYNMRWELGSFNNGQECVYAFYNDKALTLRVFFSGAVQVQSAKNLIDHINFRNKF